MPFFPLAGGEIVVLVLSFAIARWILRSWWKGELEDETLLRWLPRREPQPPTEPGPKLRLIQGGRRDGAEAHARERRVGQHRPQR